MNRNNRVIRALIAAKKAFEQQGAVGGAAWKEDLSVEHILIEQMFPYFFHRKALLASGNL